MSAAAGKRENDGQDEGANMKRGKPTAEVEEILEGKPDKKPCIVIGFFNHKGGVAKTTHLINLAASLAMQGEKTLIFDLDQQCNSTSFFLSGQTDEVSEDESKEPVDDLAITEESDSDDEEPDEQDPELQWNRYPKIAQDKLNPTITGSTDDITITRKKFGPDIFDVYQIYIQPGAKGHLPSALTRINGYSGNLWIVPGSVRLVELELSMNRQDPEKDNGGASIYGGFYDLFKEAGDRHDFKYVLVDMGPSAGALNKAATLSCDYFIAPVMPDFFSWSSVYSLLHSVLPAWLLFQDAVTKFQDKPPGAHFQFKKEPPRLLPLLASNYHFGWYKSPTADGRARRITCVTKSESRFIRSMEDLMMDRNLNDNDIRVCEAIKMLYVHNKRKLVIPFLGDVGAVNRVSHVVSVAMVALTKEDIETGLTRQGMRAGPKESENTLKKVSEVKKKYASLARFILQLEKPAAMTATYRAKLRSLPA